MRARSSAHTCLMLLVFPLLSGCTVHWLPPSESERLSHSIKKEWTSFKNTNWLGIGRQFTGLNEVLPTQQEQEIEGETILCLHPNASTRITVQDGINDDISYWQCPVSPIHPPLGQRLTDR